jgi:hypothetical protein|tara:strand:+ start:2174 stop:2314 length:141 start_codon:yes stop_codon:yes gene_type:complete
MEAHPEVESLKHRIQELERDNGNYRVQIAEYRQIVDELSTKLKQTP